MNEITKEYTLKALNQKIKKVEDYLEWQNRIVESSKRELKTKQGSEIMVGGGLSATVQYDKISATNLLEKASDEINRLTPHLVKYKEAREDIKNNY